MEKFNWKSVAEFPLYEVCKETQQIRNINTKRIISQRLDHYGYLRVNLSTKLSKYSDQRVQFKTRRVHQIVARAFIEGYSKGYVVNHIDGNKLNNHPSNLEYISQEDNLKHSWETGLHSEHAEKLSKAWDDDQYMSKAFPIRLENSFGNSECRSLREAAKIIGCSHGTISKRLRESKDNICYVKGYKIIKK